MSAYEEFVASKVIVAPPAGFTVEDDEVNAKLFPFQRELVRWALLRGRAALFEDCGLGKTPQQLEWARLVQLHTKQRVLVLAPLAVAKQTIREGVKFGIPVKYARGMEEADAPIVITNYERVESFDPSAFGGVVLDESSILKSFMGSTKRYLLSAFATTPYRLACTATPAPNDHLELGNHAEFLGVLSSHEMIARWFLPDTSTFGTYRLKGHAVEPFWDWVSSWARCVGTPSDLGYPDAGYVLPPLETKRHVLTVDVVDGRGDALFRQPDLSATAVHKEKRRTAPTRALKVAELVAAEPAEQWLVWCETDYEADALAAAIPGAVNVRGPDSPEKKEAALIAFADGATRVLITKSKIAGFGMNFQGCARQAMVGATFSYEQFYQEIRRSWRFGQTRPVHVHVVLAQTEVEILSVLLRKAAEHEALKRQMYAAMRRAHEKSEQRKHFYEPRHTAQLPTWLHSENP